MAFGLLAIAQELRLKIDLHKALVMALIHDVCEIDAGDTPAFGPQRPDQHGLSKSEIGESMIKLVVAWLVILFANQGSFADDSSRLIGVWKLLSLQTEFQDGKPPREMFGEHPSGYLILTKEGRMMSVIEGENRKAPATDSDRASLLNSLVAYSGTYRIDGNQWILSVDVAWNPTWDGTAQVRDFELVGDRLTVRSPWQHAVNFPGASLSRGIVVFTRVK